MLPFTFRNPTPPPSAHSAPVSGSSVGGMPTRGALEAEPGSRRNGGKAFTCGVFPPCCRESTAGINAQQYVVRLAPGLPIRTLYLGGPEPTAFTAEDSVANSEKEDAENRRSPSGRALPLRLPCEVVLT